MATDREMDISNALAEPDLLTYLCGEVASGSTALEVARARNIPYKALNHWINDDADRAKRYKLALDIRDDHAKDLIIAELVSYIKADVTQAFDANGNMLRIADMPGDVRKLIGGVKFREIFEMQGSGDERSKVHIGNIIEVRFWDKPRSIETFMKHLAMLVERKDLKVTMSLADLIAAADEATK